MVFLTTISCKGGYVLDHLEAELLSFPFHVGDLVGGLAWKACVCWLLGSLRAAGPKGFYN